MEVTEKDKEILKNWKELICDRSDDVDPDQDFTWQGIWVGFAIGQGMELEKATSYTFYINNAFPLELTNKKEKT